jgi:hypothetical protein
MSILLKLRNGNISLPKKYFDDYLDISWFFSSLIKFDQNQTEFIIWEDKEAVLSIFDSIRFNKLVIHNNVSLTYLEVLCDMWCAPEWLLTEIKNKQSKTINNLKFNNHVFSCISCNTGYKISENTDTSCKSHKYMINKNNNKYNCCNGDPSSIGCVVGYHKCCSYDFKIYYNIYNYDN